MPGVPQIVGTIERATVLGASSINIDKPGDVEVGDLLICIVANSNNTNTDQWNDTSLKPTGFALINETGQSVFAHTAGFWRIADGTESSSYTINAQSAPNEYRAWMFRVQGHHPTSPINTVTGDIEQTVTSLTFNVGGLTTTIDGCLCFAIFGKDRHSEDVATSGTGWTEVEDLPLNSDAFGLRSGFSTKTQAVAGSVATCTFTIGTSQETWTGFAFAVTPAPDPHVFLPIKGVGGVDLPSDFGNAETASIEVRTQGENITTETLELYAQLFQSDETTSLSDEVLAATETGDDGWTNNTMAFTGVNTSANKATWDTARIRFRWVAG